MWVLGVDIGVRWCGYAVLETRLHEAGVVDLAETPPDWPPPAYLRHALAVLLRRYPITVLALEAYHWRGHPTTHHTAVLELLGAARSLGRHTLAVEVRQPQEWQRQLMGALPTDRRWESASWKARVRDQVGLLLRHRWPEVARRDPRFGHDSDAAGLALAVRDTLRLQARLDVAR